MDNAGVSAEWNARGLDALTETTITYNGKAFAVRSNAAVADCTMRRRLPPCVRST